MSTRTPPKVAERFGRNLFLCRRRSFLSQEQLARRAGLHRTEIGLLENGARMPRLDTVVRLLGALKVPPEELLRGITWEPDGRRLAPGGFLLGPLSEEVPDD